MLASLREKLSTAETELFLAITERSRLKGAVDALAPAEVKVLPVRTATPKLAKEIAQYRRLKQVEKRTAEKLKPLRETFLALGECEIVLASPDGPRKIASQTLVKKDGYWVKPSESLTFKTH